MNVFIGCSSSQNISAKYLKVAKSVAQKLAALQLDLVFGAASTSMMGECYRAFENNNVEAVTVKTYEDDLKNLPHHFLQVTNLRKYDISLYKYFLGEL